MLRLRSLTITLALFVLIVVPMAAQRVVRPDPKAFEAARSLVARRTALADVVAQMQRTYRQSAPQTTAIFKALRTSPSAAAPAVMRVYRLSGAATTTALLQGGYSKSETVAGAPAYSCTILPTDATSAPMAGHLQAWSNNNLGPAVVEANEGFHHAVMGRLGNWQLFLPGLQATGAELRGAYGLPSGKVLLEFHH